MKRFNWLKWLGVLIFGLVTLGCQPEDEEARLYTYTPPLQRNDGWSVGHLNQHRIQVPPLEEMIRQIKRNQYPNIHSVVIIRNNVLLLEEYFPGQDVDGTAVSYAWDVRHFLASCTKSITSACLGIALDRGLLASPDNNPPQTQQDALNRKMMEFFPQYPASLWTPRKQQVTLRHMLTMSTGLDWDEDSFGYLDARSHHYQMFNSPDPLRFVLELGQSLEPGTRFDYSSGVTMLLGGVLQQVSLQPVENFAQQYLFSPLGIEDVSWIRMANGTVLASGGCYLRPRDMAKFGQLFLQQGQWNGHRIISTSWVQQSTQKQIDTSSFSDTGYGFQWWTYTFETGTQTISAYSASGWGGQEILVCPSLDMVVVFTGGNYEGNESVYIYQMLMNHILPAVR